VAGNNAVLLGANELLIEMHKLAAIPLGEPFRNDLLRGARSLRDVLRAAAPKGPSAPGRFSRAARRKGLAKEGATPDSKTRYKGGNLREGIIAGRKFGKKYPYSRDTPAAYVGLDYGMAPHINFIERGARLGGAWASAGRSGGFYQAQGIAYAGRRQGKGEKLFISGKKALRLYGYGTKVGGHNPRTGQKYTGFAAWAVPGPQPARPFWRKTVDANKNKLEQYIGICAWNRVKGVRWQYIRPEG
jgi:hypothetical protein